MKIAIDKALELTVDPWSIEQAGHCLDEIRHKWSAKTDDVLTGVFTLLLFANIERQHPGSMMRFLQQAEKLAAAMSPLQPSDA